VPALVVVFIALLATMGVLVPRTDRGAGQDLRAAVLQDYYRLEHAVSEYVTDLGEFPAPVFDLTEGFDGGLADALFVPLELRERWHGPYLRSHLGRPTRSSFWSLVEPRVLHDGDRDGEADEAWARLHRGYGELDDATAAWFDEVLDDGVADAGIVRVTPTWIWFQLFER
jgi:hypothetical protein